MSVALLNPMVVACDRTNHQSRAANGTGKSRVLGPFDLRRQRSRCERCSISHVKCSRTQPCQRCVQKGFSCKYAQREAIGMNVGQITLVTTTSLSTPKSLPLALIDEQTLVISSFVDNFLHKNRLSANDRDLEYARGHLHRYNALYHVAFAIGSLDLLAKAQPHIGSRTSPTQAIQSYRLACSILRSQLQSAATDDHYLNLIETTLLMSLFELKHSSDTVGWRRHYIYGTREFLRRLGPVACRTGPAKDMLLRVRIFEIISSILFAYRSFLATDPWLETLRTIWKHEERSVKDSMLDLANICTDHCLRSAGYASSLPEIVSDEEHAQLVVLAQEGVRMRSALDEWKLLADQEPQSLFPTDNIIADSMYHTVSIYLHTSFALQPRWAILDIPTPILQPSAVTIHIQRLLSIIDHAVDFSAICPIIFLCPLYVAGNAVNTAEHRHRVQTLLEHVQQRYCFAQRSSRQGLPFWTPDEALATDEGNSNNVLLKDRRRALLKQLSTTTS